MKGTIMYAKTIDSLDIILGPLQATAGLMAPGLGEIIMYACLAETVILKIPFVAYYMARTRDFESVGFWTQKELIANSVPGGNYLDIFRSYQKRTERTLNGKHQPDVPTQVS
jgi:hypothetical protein